MKYPTLTPSIMSKMISNLHQSGESVPTTAPVPDLVKKEDVLSFIFKEQMKEMTAYLKRNGL